MSHPRFQLPILIILTLYVLYHAILENIIEVPLLSATGTYSADDGLTWPCNLWSFQCEKLPSPTPPFCEDKKCWFWVVSPPVCLRRLPHRKTLMLALERKPQRIKQRFFHPNLNIFDGVHLGIEKGDCFSTIALNLRTEYEVTSKKFCCPKARNHWYYYVFQKVLYRHSHHSEMTFVCQMAA